MSAETVLIESLDSHGRVQSRERFVVSDARRTFTIGRSILADVTLDDPHAAAMHAALEIAPDGRIFANDLGSVNGLIVSGKPCRNACGLELADNVLQIGRTRLRVRTSHANLAPEKPYRTRSAALLHGPAWIAGIAAIAGGLQLIYASWLGAPRDLAAGIVTALAAAASLVAIWVAVWGLLSRVMQGEWRWLRHIAIALGIAVAYAAVMGLVDLSGFLFALPPWTNRQTWIGAVALGGALFLHLIHASNLAASRAALVACLVPLLLGVGGEWLQARYMIRDVNHIGSRVRIYPPSLRLRPSEKVEDYFKRAASLRPLADKRLIDALANDPGYDDDR